MGCAPNWQRPANPAISSASVRYPFLICDWNTKRNYRCTSAERSACSSITMTLGAQLRRLGEQQRMTISFASRARLNTRLLQDVRVSLSPPATSTASMPADPRFSTFS